MAMLLFSSNLGAVSRVQQAAISSYQIEVGIGSQGPIYVTDPQVKAASDEMTKRFNMPRQFSKYPTYSEQTDFSNEGQDPDDSKHSENTRPKGMSFADVSMQTSAKLQSR